MFSFVGVKSVLKGLSLSAFMFLTGLIGSTAARGHGGEEEILPFEGSTVDGATVTSSLESGSSSSTALVGVAVVFVLGAVGAAWVMFRNKEDSVD
ncbi:MAG: hypothetical protein ACKOW9_00445 [Candidatus Paceibacterota bacterium]